MPRDSATFASDTGCAYVLPAANDGSINIDNNTTTKYIDSERLGFLIRNAPFYWIYLILRTFSNIAFGIIIPFFQQEFQASLGTCNNYETFTELYGSNGEIDKYAHNCYTCHMICLFYNSGLERVICMLSWEQLIKDCSDCNRCNLGRTRSNIVIERGSRNAPLMFVGEGPGEQEDLQGKPFVGPAGKLLDLLLDALMFKKDEYYIANIVKCRPPGNRVPLDEEAEKCLPFLRNQVLLVKPQIIVCLGSTAMKYIIDRDARITKIRGQWIERKGFWIMPTFHPAALLRDESKKVLMWEDIKKVKNKLESLCQNRKI